MFAKNYSAQLFSDNTNIFFFFLKEKKLYICELNQ